MANKQCSNRKTAENPAKNPAIPAKTRRAKAKIPERRRRSRAAGWAQERRTQRHLWTAAVMTQANLPVPTTTGRHRCQRS